MGAVCCEKGGKVAPRRKADDADVVLEDLEIRLALPEHREGLTRVMKRTREATLSDSVPHDHGVDTVPGEPFRDWYALVLVVREVAAAGKNDERRGGARPR